MDDASSRSLDMEWRLIYLPGRTHVGPTIKLEYKLASSTRKSKPRKTYRNPLIYAMELAEDMRREGLTQADLARKHGISRARVNQWLSLLKLSAGVRKMILEMGDHWERQVITERGLRKLIKYGSRESNNVFD